MDEQWHASTCASVLSHVQCKERLELSLLNFPSRRGLLRFRSLASLKGGRSLMRQRLMRMRTSKRLIASGRPSAE